MRMIGFEKIKYSELNARQKENFNFQKVAAKLADYGFNCLRLTDDWQGADFIACHIQGNDFLKVQLKGRFTINSKYRGKEIYIAFLDGDDCYFFPHDEVLANVLEKGIINNSESWKVKGGYSWPNLSGWAKDMLGKYQV